MKNDIVMTKDDNEWQMKCDAETLLKAVEIASDFKRFDKAQQFLKDQKDNLMIVTDPDYLKKIGLRK